MAKLGREWLQPKQFIQPLFDREFHMLERAG
jgi:hypothetical protein